MKKIVTIIVLCLFTNACAAALVAGAFYKSSKTKGQRQQFMVEFNKTNMEREQKGLKPLDWCSEAYKFDKGWADNNKECANRIKAYESGNQKALKL